MKTDAEFDVFISYSHADLTFAERLSRRIRRYRPPLALGLGRRRLSVFRDVERLTAHAELSEALSERIDSARNLLIICSPEAAQSKYVNEEVAAFLARKPRDAVQLVLASGNAKDAFPSALKSAFREPLFIDMRAGGGWWKSLWRFHEQSLRVIAALLKVDFATLHREDERRTVRQRWAAVAMLLIAALTIASSWLVSSVPIDTWARVDVPTDYLSNRLLPITNYAVNHKLPDLRLFQAFGAAYAAQRPPNHIGVIGESMSNAALQKFRDATVRHLRETIEPAKAWQPIANFPFTVVHDLQAVGGEDQGSNREQWGSGELYLHAFLSGSNGAPAFAWSLRYAGRNLSGTALQINSPATAAARDDPFHLEPWPANEFIRAGALPEWGYLRGELITAWNTRLTLSFRLVDAAEQFSEANDGMWIESAVVTDGDRRRKVTIAGKSISIADLDADAWEQVLSDDTWATPRAPRVERVSNLYIHRDKAGKVEARNGSSSIQTDATILELLQRNLDFEPEIDHTVTHVVRDRTRPKVETLTVVTRLYDERAEIYEHDKTQYFVRVGNAVWKSLTTLRLQAATTILDILPMDGGTNRFLLLTDREGFRLTDDGGTTWRDFNHREPALLDGSHVRPLVAGIPSQIYALVDHDDPKVANPLFHHVRRNWSARLRVALAQMLQPEGQPVGR